MSATALVRRQGVVLVGLLTAALTGRLFLAWAVLDTGEPAGPPDDTHVGGVGCAHGNCRVLNVVHHDGGDDAPVSRAHGARVRALGPARRRLGSHLGFVGAYVLMWAGFSSLAAVMHWALQAAGLLSSMMVSVDPLLTAVLLITAGAFQFTPLQTACLTRCRSPVSFLMTEWRKGRVGAFVMGMRHGMYCIGCCWALMSLLFVIGVMNLPMVAMIAIAVALEKLAPKGVWIARAIGGVLVIGGTWMLLGETGMTSLGM